MMLKVSTGYQSSDQVGEKESVKVTFNKHNSL